MPASKAKVIENLSQVKNLGETYATAAYEDLSVRNLDDLIEAAKANKLQDIKGIGAAKEKKILASAEALKSESAPTPTPEKKGKSGSKAKETPKKEQPKKAAADAKKEEPKKEAPKKEEPKSASSPRPRKTYRPPEPKSRPTIPGLLFKLGKKIIGRILG